MKHSQSSLHSAKGQALAEFIVLALALVPLFLIIPVIAKYQDISNSTQMASRYVAFDATTRNDSMSTWKPATQLADEVRRRFYSNTDAPIKTDDTAGNFMAHQNLFWRDPKGDSLINNIGVDVAVSFGEAHAATHSQGFKSANDGVIFGSSIPLSPMNLMGLQARGIYRGNVSITLANLPAGIKSYEPFDQINLRMQRGTSLIFDHWMANSPQQTMDRFGRAAPINQVLSVLQPLTDGPILLYELLNFDGPKYGDLKAWEDFVPAENLKP